MTPDISAMLPGGVRTWYQPVQQHDRNAWHLAAAVDSSKMLCGLVIPGSPLVGRPGETISGEWCTRCLHQERINMWDGS